MNTFEHTPGKWETLGEDGGERVISFADSKGKPRTLAHVYDGANARRIVACVNACDGISTEALEREPGSLGMSRDAIRAERDRLRKINAKWVRQLERVMMIYEKNSARMAPMIAGNDQMEPLMVEISLAIAKAKT